MTSPPFSLQGRHMLPLQLNRGATTEARALLSWRLHLLRRVEAAVAQQRRAASHPLHQEQALWQMQTQMRPLSSSRPAAWRHCRSWCPRRRTSPGWVASLQTASLQASGQLQWMRQLPPTLRL